MTDLIVENETIQSEIKENIKENNVSNVQNENVQQDKDLSKVDNSEVGDNIYGSPDDFDYSEIKLPEGMTLDEELINEFNPIAKKFNLSNSSANELVNLAVKLSNKNAANLHDAVEQVKMLEKNSYLQLLNSDKELNTHNSAEYEQYLDVATQGLKAVSTPGFNDFIREKGLTHHPEFIKVFHKIGTMCKDAYIPDASIPVGIKRTPADILYGRSSDN